MPESPIPLTPDEEQQSAMQMPGRRTVTGQPYALAAVIVGLLLLLVLRGLLSRFSGLMIVNAAILVALLAYSALLLTHTKLPLRALAVLASVLGALYSLPAGMVYYSWGNPPLLALFVWWIVLAGIVGTIISYWLKVDEQPVQVFAINFLVMFVIAGFTTFV